MDNSHSENSTKRSLGMQHAKVKELSGYLTGYPPKVLHYPLSNQLLTDHHV